jgi:hypothetical protein
MNDPAKKRPWFQFSLMTAIVMMLAASGLLWLNTQQNRWSGNQGWPFSYRVWKRTRIHGFFIGFETKWLLWWLVGDVVVGLAVVFIIAFLCESLVRRQDRQRQQREGAKP